MSGREKFYWLMGGVLTLLAVASIVAAVLRVRARPIATSAAASSHSA